MSLSRFSIWRGSRAGLPDYIGPAVEEAGFARLWLGNPPQSLDIVEKILSETQSLQVASGIVNIWHADPHVVATSYHRVEQGYPGRFLLGIGTGHRESVAQYERPYDAISAYLDVLDAEGVPVERRVLAALGPRLLKLAGERSAGAHPYLVPPEHTARARAILGPDKLLVPEHKVVMDTDPDSARTTGRTRVQTPYLGLANYTNNLRRLGFGDDDLAGAGSDRLIDALVAHGDPDSVATALGAHLEAGADEVAVQLVVAGDADLRPGLTALADALGTYEAAHPA